MNSIRIKELKVRFLPTTIDDHSVSGRCVVMADILRASTTMVSAMSNGCLAIHPRAEIEDARNLAAELGGETLLGGERGGKIVDGFDMGNSPVEYDSARIGGKRLVLCTTNGTFTLEKCRAASRILIGGFVNLDSVCQLLKQHEHCLIACAGTNRMVTDEDVLFAGAVVDSILKFRRNLELDDAARIAWARWNAVSDQLDKGTQLWEVFAQSHGGRNLVRLGFEKDIQFCARRNTHELVPELDLDSWAIYNSNSQVTV